MAYTILGNNLIAQGMPREAEAAYRKAIVLKEQTLEKRRSSLGSDHPDTLRSTNELARSYDDLGYHLMAYHKPREAEAAVRKAIELEPDYAVAYTNLEQMLTEQQRLREVETLVSDLIERARKQDGQKALEFAWVLYSIGHARMTRSQYAEAEPLVRECLAICEKHGPDRWYRFMTVSLLGQTLLGQHKYAAAEALLLEGYEGLRQAKTPDTEDALDEAIEYIVRLYQATEQEEKARMWAGKFPVHGDKTNFVRAWLVLSELVPYAGMDGVKALDEEQIPGEALLRPRAGDRVQVEGKTLVWKEYHGFRRYIDFAHGLRSENKLAYAVCYVHADADRTGLVLRAGSHDQAKLYVNGAQVYRQVRGRGLKLDEDEITPITLRKGTNVLVFKVVNQSGPGPQGSLRFLAKDGRAAEGLQFGLEP